MKLYNELVDKQEAISLINQGKVLIVAGSENVLAQLPKGNWIGGTIPYFMTNDGGLFNADKIFVSDITSITNDFEIIEYTKSTIKNMPSDASNSGFTYLLLPGLSDIHSHYALQTPLMPDLMNRPIFGWVAGVDLNMIGKESPKVFNGLTAGKSDKTAIGMHIQLHEGLRANVDIINIFSQDNKGDILQFTDNGFSCKDIIVNGEKRNFIEYIEAKGIDTQLPIVANFSGASINISIQDLDKETGIAYFYAPVQEGVEYRFAEPVGDYMSAFSDHVLKQGSKAALSCNCILNYLYSDLEGKRIENFNGPFTFGEIAYILVNQTLVHLDIS